MLHIAVSADCAGPKGFSFELITTVSAESGCIPRVPFRRAVCPAAAGGVIEANAGNVVAAAEAAPTMRRNDRRETPCVISEFIESSPRKVRFGEKRHHGDRRKRPTEDPEDLLHIACKSGSPCSNYSLGTLEFKTDRVRLSFNLARIIRKY